MIGSAKITSKGQVTLPKKIRDYLDVAAGDIIIFELKNGDLSVRKSASVESLFGSLSPLKENIKKKVIELIARDANKKLWTIWQIPRF